MNVIPIPTTVSTSIIISPVLLPKVANFPPNREPKAPPSGTAVEISAL